MTRDDIKYIKDLTNTNTDIITNLFNNAINKIVIEDDGIKGFALIKKLGALNELSAWHLNPEHSLLLKAITRKINGPIAAAEQESNEGRIKILESAGFKKQSIIDGVFNDARAVMLTKTN